jgi:16S rRNA (guanine966-N2)-methyltransferase
MRIIAGEAKGRPLQAVRGRAVRPTADRVREALFSIVLSRFVLKDATVLDLFAGTGALGIEALSRGAAHAVFVERDGRALRALRANLLRCGLDERAQILPMSAQRALRALAERRKSFDGVFVDPPYGKGLAAASLRLLSMAALLGAGAWVMVEHHADDVLEPGYGNLRLTQTRRYGKTCLTLYCAEHIDRQLPGSG